ncbi:MAG: dTMP kinase [Deltaproteobacteria bacterium]|nr:dTMP kinase [Deltaproteobacteria bacterium]
MSTLITFEGIEGSGKTTQMDLLKDHLEWKGKVVRAVREPGGTLIGEKIREILLNVHGEKEEEGITQWAELFLYEASRAQLVDRVIKPALSSGAIVLCDRFVDSTTAYQGYGRGLDIKSVAEMNRLGSLGIKPKVTIVVDCPVEVGLKRAWTRIEARSSVAAGREDRFEKEAADFHGRVRQGYLRLAEEEPERVKVVDGTREIAVIHREICGIIDDILG